MHVPLTGSFTQTGTPLRIEYIRNGQTKVTTLTPERRGDFAAARVTVRSLGPLGLAGRQGSHHAPWSVRVLPPFTSRRHLPEKLARLRQLDGQHRSLLRGQGSEFDSLREYHPDDEFRRTNWRATARGTRTISNTYREERNQQVLLLVDASRIMAVAVAGVPRFEHTLDAGIALAELAGRAGDHVGMAAFGAEVLATVSPRSGRSQARRILEQLFDLEPSLDAPNYRRAFATVLARNRRRARVRHLQHAGAGEAHLHPVRVPVRGHQRAADHRGARRHGAHPPGAGRPQAVPARPVAAANGQRAPDPAAGTGRLRAARRGGHARAAARRQPVAAVAFMMNHGPEHWHPDPDFYYQVGAGPMFDMGPYYLTALVNLLGPVRRVTGSAQITSLERTITSEPKYGTMIRVNTPTHVAGLMDFASGAVGTIITSFDVWGSNLPRIEIYGTNGTLSVPDPNTFGGPVGLTRARQQEWENVPLTHGHAENSRGLGVADMAAAIRSGRSHRASGALAYHVLDLMHAFHDASREGKHIDVASTCERPAALQAGLPDGVVAD